jgi:hypothetical protein
VNPTPGSKWDASPKAVEWEFVRPVNVGGVACRVRDTRGREIAAVRGRRLGFDDGEFAVMSAPSLYDPAAEELMLTDVTGRSATEVARTARTLLGEQFSSMSFMYVLMRAFEVEFHAARDASRWHEFHGGPRALSDADLEALLAPWLPAR